MSDDEWPQWVYDALDPRGLRAEIERLRAEIERLRAEYKRMLGYERFAHKHGFVLPTTEEDQ